MSSRRQCPNGARRTLPLSVCHVVSAPAETVAIGHAIRGRKVGEVWTYVEHTAQTKERGGPDYER